MDCNVLHSCVFCVLPMIRSSSYKLPIDGIFMSFVLVSVFNEFPVKDV